MTKLLLTGIALLILSSTTLFAQWTTVCGTGNGFVDNFEVFNNELYATGFFTNLCGTANNHIVKWDGSAFQPVGTGYQYAGHQLKYLGNFLYFVGYEPTVTDSNWVYQYGGTDFFKVGEGVYLTNAVSGGSQTANLYALEEYNGNIIACGEFDRVGNKAISGIMQWDGSAWDSLGSGLSGNIAGTAPVMYPHDMCHLGTDLIVAGNFLKAGGITVNGIARWDGSQWHNLGEGFNGTVYGMGVFNGELYAGGDFTMSGSTALKCVAKWNGTAWVDPGFRVYYNNSGDYSFVHTLKVFNSKLYIAGGFDRVVEGTTVHMGQGICAFDGTTVDTLGGGTPNREIEGIAWYDGDLYVGGGINNSNSYIAKYDGSASLSELEKITWTIVPNPAENSCTLSGSKKDQLISILTLEGRCCKTILAEESETQIDFSELSSGVYLVKIGDQQRRIVKK
ncbi:T9SS type A sorting domain-containing protein [Fluviicola chungangensis]|uniref:T9SS type A sorting domain-containing protein n=1 Tax=Fluviicola chungangensis TaxID=2597671 RepID=A0A556MQ06_9FLAO|nr:T9SS type A sorting domain-containing protein [Fluviicola chungangensis]TSJ42037.1 T9SS type A sorting domain-containing protein [Fluviicola chungangensis]